MANKPIQLHKRFFNYLQKAWQTYPDRPVPRKTLFELAQGNGYTNKRIWNALDKLDENVQIAKYTLDGVGVVYQYLDMTLDEIKKRKSDIKWFNSL